MKKILLRSGGSILGIIVIIGIWVGYDLSTISPTPTYQQAYTNTPLLQQIFSLTQQQFDTSYMHNATFSAIGETLTSSGELHYSHLTTTQSGAKIFCLSGGLVLNNRDVFDGTQTISLQGQRRIGSETTYLMLTTGNFDGTGYNMNTQVLQTMLSDIITTSGFLRMQNTHHFGILNKPFSPFATIQQRHQQLTQREQNFSTYTGKAKIQTMDGPISRFPQRRSQDVTTYPFMFVGSGATLQGFLRHQGGHNTLTITTGMRGDTYFSGKIDKDTADIFYLPTDSATLHLQYTPKNKYPRSYTLTTPTLHLQGNLQTQTIDKQKYRYKTILTYKDLTDTLPHPFTIRIEGTIGIPTPSTIQQKNCILPPQSTHILKAIGKTKESQ